MTNVSTSAELRTVIQNVTSLDPIIILADGSYSVTTLAKTPSNRSEPAVPFINGYTISGSSRSTVIVNDTRIYQENIDGPYAPAEIISLTLQYNSATTNNTAILRATTGTYTLDDLLITGPHAGWAGNGGVYMALTVSDGNTPINASLNLTNSTISVTGQVGTASFLQSWNNNGTLNIGGSGTGNTFNESGYNRGSFHFASMYPGGAQGTKLGTYDITDNMFIGGGTTRANSNRLENVNAMVSGNSFKSGSYLDLAGKLDQTKVGGNIFETIADGPGIRFTQKSSSNAVLDTTGLTLSGNTFTGYGLALVNNDSAIATSSVVKAAGTFNVVSAGTMGPKSSDTFCAGGRFADTITGTTGSDWLSGGAGNDTISADTGADWIIGGAGSDTISTGATSPDMVLYYDPSEGGDTITDFTASGSPIDKIAFRSSTFGNLTSLTLNSTFIKSATPTPPIGSTGPMFLYNTGNGQLTYDSNGETSGGDTLIATLITTPNITVNNFVFF